MSDSDMLVALAMAARTDRPCPHLDHKYNEVMEAHSTPVESVLGAKKKVEKDP